VVFEYTTEEHSSEWTIAVAASLIFDILTGSELLPWDGFCSCHSFYPDNTVHVVRESAGWSVQWRARLVSGNVRW
jgi:hypothetical protein